MADGRNGPNMGVAQSVVVKGVRSELDSALVLDRKTVEVTAWARQMIQHLVTIHNVQVCRLDAAILGGQQT